MEDKTLSERINEYLSEWVWGESGPKVDAETSDYMFAIDKMGGTKDINLTIYFDEEKLYQHGAVVFVEEIMEKAKFELHVPITGDKQVDSISVQLGPFMGKISRPEILRLLSYQPVEDLGEGEQDEDALFDATAVKAEIEFAPYDWL